MHIFFELPILIKILGVFALVLFLIRRKQPLGTAFLAGALLLGAWSRMTPGQILISAGTTSIQAKTLLLNAIVVLILILSHSLDKVGQMKRLLASFRGLSNNAKFNIVVFPALIGLLPMPGGAIFSAPMVGELGKEQQLDPEGKSLINYWFRHVWEFCWPLYPGPLLTASLASISIWLLAAMSIPLSLIAIGGGYVFLLNTVIQTESPASSNVSAVRLLIFFKELFPIALVVVGALVGSAGISWGQHWLPALAVIPTELPLVISLLISILLVWVLNKASWAVVKTILVNKALLNMIYMVTAIYIFKGILVDSDAVVDLSDFLAAQKIPVLLVMMILPAIVGLISGISVAFVGTTFPVLISLLHTLQIDGLASLPYLILAFASGFMGVMFSPLHVCLILTGEYFEADVHRIYRRLWMPVVTLLTGALCYFGLLRLLNV